MTVNKGTPTVPAPTLNPSGSATAGTSVSLSVTISGSVVTPAGTASFEASVNGGGYAAIGSAVTLSSGYASTTYTPQAVGSYRFQVIYNGDSNYNSDTSSPASLTVNHGSAVSLTVLPSSASITAGSYQAFTATDKDADGNVWDVTSAVTWSIQAGADGSVSNSGLAIADRAGIWTVYALDGAGNIGSTSLTVNAGSATQLVFNVIGDQTAGSFVVKITAQDQYGNPDTTYAGTPTLSDLSGTISPTNITFANGIWSNLVNVTLAGSDSIAATDGAITGTSNTFMVNPDSLASIMISPVTQTITVGSSKTYSAEGFDKYGNSLDDVTSSATFSVDGSPIVGASVTETVATSYSVTASIGGVTSNTATLTVTPATLDHLTISPTSAAITAGGSQSFTVNSYDQYRNLIATSVSATLKVNSVAITGSIVSETVAGSYTIEADYGGKAVTTTLTVNPTGLTI